MRWAGLLLALVSCGAAPVVPPPTPPKTCRFGPAKAGPELGDTALNELSGLVASRVNAGVLYANNDSGDTARFFAMDSDAKALGRFELDGAKANDWEDLSIGPCPAGTCVYIGDIGDNLLARTDCAVYRVKEPELPAGKVVGTVKVLFERFPFQYPNAEKHNAETLFVHPVSGEVFIVDKQFPGDPSTVFKFPMPMDATKTAVLIKVATLAVPAPKDNSLTGGALSPDGTSLLLRMYNRLVELKLPEGAPFEKIFSAKATAVPVSAEQQGEAVAWRADGRGYFTASEEVGVKPTLNKVECQP